MLQSDIQIIPNYIPTPFLLIPRGVSDVGFSIFADTDVDFAF